MQCINKLNCNLLNVQIKCSHLSVGRELLSDQRQWCHLQKKTTIDEDCTEAARKKHFSKCLTSSKFWNITCHIYSAYLFLIFSTFKRCAYIICMFLLICLFIYKLDASSSQSRHLEGVRDVPRHSANLPMLHHIFRIFANASVDISNAFQLKMCSFFNKQMKCLVISWSISLWNAQESMSWWYVVRSQRISMVLPSHLLSNLTMSLAHE